MAFLPLLLAALGPLKLPQEPAPSPAPAKVDELFRASCMACHIAPDPRFAVERAWIAQVADTA